LELLSVLVLDIIEIFPPLGKYKHDTWRIVLVKCYIDNSVPLRSCIRNVNNILIDGGAALNLINLSTFKKLQIPMSKLQPSHPFSGVGLVSFMPCGCISLPVTFRTPENFHTKSILFFIAEVNLPFKASLGRSGLYQFMAVAHYRYLVLKMLSPNDVLKICGDHDAGVSKWGETSTRKLAVLVVLIPWSPPRIIGVTGDSIHAGAQDLEAQVDPDAWIMVIQTYLKDNILPEDNASADQIARLAKRYTLVEGDLYRCGANSIVMQCITQEERYELLVEVHGGKCGNHASSHMLVGKAFQHGFY
jgi:hypothetical protein